MMAHIITTDNTITDTDTVARLITSMASQSQRDNPESLSHSQVISFPTLHCLLVLTFTITVVASFIQLTSHHLWVLKGLMLLVLTVITSYPLHCLPLTTSPTHHTLITLLLNCAFHIIMPFLSISLQYTLVVLQHHFCCLYLPFHACVAVAATHYFPQTVRCDILRMKGGGGLLWTSLTESHLHSLIIFYQ